MGRKLDAFTPLSYKQQLVNGVNYFIKVHVGGDDHVHVRAHQTFQGATTLSKVQDKKSANDDIEHF